MNKWILGFCIIIISMAAVAQEDIFLPYSVVITDAKSIFSIPHSGNTLLAFDACSGAEMQLTIPVMDLMSDIYIRSANTLSNGFAVVSNYSKPDSAASHRAKAYSGIFFFDPSGNFVGRFEYSDRTFFAVAPWGANAVIVAWARKVYHEGEFLYSTGLTAVDREGGLIAEIGGQKAYSGNDYWQSMPHTWAYQRLYWQGENLVYVDAMASSVTRYGRDGRLLNEVHVNLDPLGSPEFKFFTGFFHVSDQEIYCGRVFSVSDQKAYWISSKEPGRVNPLGGRFRSVHLIGDISYALVYDEKSCGGFLKRITEGIGATCCNQGGIGPTAGLTEGGEAGKPESKKRDCTEGWESRGTGLSLFAARTAGPPEGKYSTCNSQTGWWGVGLHPVHFSLWKREQEGFAAGGGSIVYSSSIALWKREQRDLRRRIFRERRIPAVPHVAD